VCDLETSRICTPYIYDISSLRVNKADNSTDKAWSYVCSRDFT